jgi:hypothetical protein
MRLVAIRLHCTPSLRHAPFYQLVSLLAIAALATGCSLPATSPYAQLANRYPTEAERAELGRVAVVVEDRLVSERAPAQPGPDGKPAPTREIVAVDVLRLPLGADYPGIGGGGGGGVEGLVITLVIVGIEGGIVAINESASTVPAETAASATAKARTIISTTILSDALGQVAKSNKAVAAVSSRLEVVKAPETQNAGDLSRLQSLAEQNFQSALILETGMEMKGRRGTDPLFTTQFGVVAHLFNTRTGREIYRRRLRFWDGPAPLHAWMQDDAHRLRASLNQGAQWMTEELVEEIFYVMAFPRKDSPNGLAHGNSFGSECGLPQGNAKEPTLMALMPAATLVEVVPLQPALVWSTFPRAEDAAAEALKPPHRVSGVSYELKLWQDPIHRSDQRRVDAPASALQLIEHVSDLSMPTYNQKTPLVSDALYLWSVRAWFQLDEQLRATEWSIAPSQPEWAGQWICGYPTEQPRPWLIGFRVEANAESAPPKPISRPPSVQ